MARPLYLILLDLPWDLFQVFRRERLPQIAAALAFSSALTVVPLATLVLVVASSLPGFDALLKHWDYMVVHSILPGATGGVVVSNVTMMAARARELTGPWLLVLAGLVFLMLHTLEVALNQIWGVREGRSWWRRLPMYLLGMLMLPLLMGILSSLPALVIYLSAGWLGRIPPFQEGVLKLLNLMALAGFFFLFYYALPNVKVHIRSALLGAMLVSLALGVAQQGFLWYLARASFYSQVYGALAALPIFLLWLYLAWVLVLCGAILVASLDGAFIGRSFRT
ncbi:MAG: YhjD/YihY/BrkB family envelope integrity protein [Azovibrio sp.]